MQRKSPLWNKFYSCNMGASELTDMYAQSPRAVGMHTYQANHECQCYQLFCSTPKADSLDANTSVVTISFIYAFLEDLVFSVGYAENMLSALWYCACGAG